ncbi:MAG: putative nucleotidyltransferase with HDIG domain [Planctomycetota bacterium]
MIEADEGVPIVADTEATLLSESVIATLVNSRIYALSHPRVIVSMDEVRDRTRTLVELTGELSVRLSSHNGMLVFHKRPLLGASLGVTRLNEKFEDFGAGGIEIDGTVSTTELGIFFATLIDKTTPATSVDTCNEQLRLRQCTTVRLLQPYTSGVNDGFGDPVRMGLSFHQNVMDLLQTITVSVCRGGQIDFGPVQTQSEKVLKRLEAQGDLRLSLARQDQYDAFTFGHSLRVAILSMHFAQSLTDDRELLIRIGTAALLHDVGKSLIPFEILHSTHMLDEDERNEMNKHAELGAECLLDHSDSDPLAIAAAFGHHRTPGGNGYPRTKHAHPISMVTSIVKICDIFEALTAARPYKLPMSPIRAYRVMLAMGDKLDRKLLRKFIEVNGVYPIGQFVKLDDGKRAVVRGQTEDMFKPVVALLDSDDPINLLERDEELLDLSDIACGCVRSILCEMTPDHVMESSVGPQG